VRRASGRSTAGATHYGPAAGLPELREAIVKDVEGNAQPPGHLGRDRGDPGGQAHHVLRDHRAGEPGRRGGPPNPGFPIYESVINFVGGKPVPIPLREESGFGFDLDVLEKSVSRKTKLIIINSPQNPTGGVLEVDQLGRIAEIAKHYRIPVLADEIYKAFLYEGEFASITRFPGNEGPGHHPGRLLQAYAMTAGGSATG